ncbi:ribonuclease D [Devosia sp. J2-20]|jgi:ribonuclease D|uniref:Ribonuclease D n=1 Tax=Devosia litorisediminis TaxID=2829817 RepID=A0A942E6K7_9HYPH|nr:MULTISPECIES: ribonuclease D [Devosia]MBS3848402.1 ribonuclease D [Devosia litorisediminis]MCZ4345086.1 ribonuclease D [Devosia neptuniae]WDQ98520.1 ribonuclease D [Devosia sp. J2-20]|tara:strand:+ start:48394 stop:49572 length:1179 start_codon:yes stop_codon:yes gene_type:complete
MDLIVSTDVLADFCERAAKFDFVTVDTEFLRETTYWPKLCLIQVATDDEAVLIDPLAPDFDLSPFYDLLANPDVTKVFHAARQDVEIFVKATGQVPANIFDTQVAASVCGFGDSVSYDNLVRSITSVELDKSSRFTDWSARPLSEKQRLYAIADVTHLRDIYRELRKQVAATRRGDWVEDEMGVLRSIDTYVVQPEQAWVRLKMKINRPRDLAALKKLAAWREQRAQDTDQPRSRVLKDDVLFELAMQRPLTPDAFERLRMVPRGFGRSSAAGDIMALLKQVEDIPKSELPSMPERYRGPSPKGAVGDLVRVLLKAVAEQNGVAARIIATSDEIDALVLDDEADVPALKGWRRKLFGEKALAIKHGRIGLVATRKGIVEIEVKEPKQSAAAE